MVASQQEQTRIGCAQNLFLTRPVKQVTSTARVFVGDRSFGVFDEYQIPVHTGDWSTGLIVTMSIGAMIYTGINRGYVQVTTVVRDQAPEQIDAGLWDDIVEASVYTNHGELRIQCLDYGPENKVPELPLLSPNGPGHYRLRAHVRGRDLHPDAVCHESTEEYLLCIWPAEPTPSLIIRATDQCGYGLRLSDLPRQARAHIPVPPAYIAPNDTPRGRLIEANLRAAGPALPDPVDQARRNH